MIPRRKQKAKISDLFHFLVYSFDRDNNQKRNHSKEFKESFANVASLPPDQILTTSSGREAILLGIRSMGLVDGDEIIISALNLGELVPLLQDEGFPVKIVDINTNDLSMNSDAFELAITAKTKLIIITHLFSIVADNSKIISTARERGLLVLEDSAHTLDHSGNADAVIFSFETNKPISTYGGGALYLKSKENFEKAKSLLETLDYNPKAFMRKISFTIAEEALIRSPFFKPIINVLSSPKIQKIFEKFYRGTNNKVRVSSKYLSFQSMLGLKELSIYPVRNRILKSIVTEFHQIQNPSIQFIEALTKTKSFYSFVFLTQNPLHFKKTAFNNNIDIGIGSEAIDDCSKYFPLIQCKNSKAIEQQIVVFPLYFDMTNEEILRLLVFLKSYQSPL